MFVVSHSYIIFVRILENNDTSSDSNESNDDSDNYDREQIKKMEGEQSTM